LLRETNVTMAPMDHTCSSQIQLVLVSPSTVYHAWSWNYSATDQHEIAAYRNYELHTCVPNSPFPEVLALHETMLMLFSVLCATWYGWDDKLTAGRRFVVRARVDMTCLHY